MQECRATDPAVIFRRVVTDLMETIVQTTRSSRDFPFLRAKRRGLARQTSFGIHIPKLDAILSYCRLLIWWHTKLALNRKSAPFSAIRLLVMSYFKHCASLQTLNLQFCVVVAHTSKFRSSLDMIVAAENFSTSAHVLTPHPFTRPITSSRRLWANTQNHEDPPGPRSWSQLLFYLYNPG